MLAGLYRFHGYNSLRYVYTRGQTVRGQDITLKYCQNPKRERYRAAVVVSKKVSKSAVVRNRIRRRLYEAIRLYDPVDHADIVLMVYNVSVAELPSGELTRQVETLFKRADLLSTHTAVRNVVDNTK